MTDPTPMLRELTIRYAVKADQTGQPVPIGQTLTTPQDAASIFMRLLGDEAAEVFGVLLLSTRRQVIAYFEVTRGSLNTTIVQPRDVFKAALLSNAEALVLAHYVARNIMPVMCPTALCGLVVESRTF